MITRCGDQRLGGLPFYWLNSKQQEEAQIRSHGRADEQLHVLDESVIAQAQLHGSMNFQSNIDRVMALQEVDAMRQFEHLMERPLSETRSKKYKIDGNRFTAPKPVQGEVSSNNRAEASSASNARK